ncbi:Ataxin-10 [Coemansia sp. RSA 2424]|nr:Ataxin-10 [Coemansia sp. RSA 2424]
MELTDDATRKARQECAEYRQRSPHPSRPQHSATIDLAVWLDIHRLFESLKVGATDASSDNKDHLVVDKAEGLTDLCLFVRNAAAMERANQDLASSTGIIGDIRRTISAMIRREMEYPEATRCVTTAAQALSNLVTGNRPLQRALLEQELTTGVASIDTVFCYLLASANSQTNMAGLVLLLNCLKDNPEATGLLCSTEAGRLVASKVGELFGDNENDESDVKTMLYMILSQIIDCGKLDQLLRDELELRAYGLVDALAVYCNEHSSNADYQKVVSKDLVAALTRLLSKSHAVLVHVWEDTAAIYSSDNDIRGDVDMDDIMDAHRCLAAVISALGSITTEGSADIANWLLECKTVHLVIALLGLLNKHLPRIESADKRQSGLQASGAGPGDVDSVKHLFMFKCDLIKIIGNLGYKSAAAQDLVRELDGLSLVLDHMKIDDNHPFIKEHAVIALKGLLSNNRANQDFLRDVNVVDSIQDPKLAKAGIQAVITNDGQVSVKQAAPDSKSDRASLD